MSGSVDDWTKYYPGLADQQPAPVAPETYSQGNPQSNPGLSTSGIAKEDGETSWADYGRSAWGGTLRLGAGLAGLVEYAGGAEGGEAAGAARRALSGEADYQTSQMTEAGQRALGASFLPSEGEASVTDRPGQSIGLKAAAMLPSLLSSILPGAVVARAMAGAGATIGATRAAVGAVAGGTNAATSAGDVFASMAEDFGRMSEDDKLEQSPLYAYLRNTGSTDIQATRETIQEAAGYKPVYAGLISAAAGGLFEGRAIADIATGTTRGVMAAARQGAQGEAREEFVQSGAEDAFGQAGMGEAVGRDFDFQKMIAAAIEGGFMGGLMGGAMGGAGGLAAPSQAGPGNTPDDAQTAALSGAPVGPADGVVLPEGPGSAEAQAAAMTGDPMGPRDDWYEAGQGDSAAAQRQLFSEIRAEQDPLMRHRLIEFGQAAGFSMEGVDLDEGASPMEGMAASQTSAPAREGQASRPGPNRPADDGGGVPAASPLNNVAGEDHLAALGPVVPPAATGVASAAAAGTGAPAEVAVPPVGAPAGPNPGGQPAAPQSPVAPVVTPEVSSPDPAAAPAAPGVPGPSPAAQPLTPQAAPPVSVPEVAPAPKLTGPQQGALDLLERQAAVIARLEKVPEDLIDAVLADLRAELGPQVAGVRGGASEIAGQIAEKGLLRQLVQERAIARLDEQLGDENFDAAKAAKAAAATGRNARRKDAEIRMDADWRTVRSRVAKLVAAGDSSPIYEEIVAYKPGRGGPPAEKAAKIASLKERLAEHETKAKATKEKAAARAKEEAPPTLKEILDGNLKPEGREKLADFIERMRRIVANAKQAGIKDPFTTRVEGMLAREAGISRADMQLLEVAEFKARAGAEVAALDAEKKKLAMEVGASGAARRAAAATAEFRAALAPSLGESFEVAKRAKREDWSDDAPVVFATSDPANARRSEVVPEGVKVVAPPSATDAARAMAEFMARGGKVARVETVLPIPDAGSRQRDGEIDLSKLTPTKAENLIDVIKALPQRNLLQRALMTRLLPHLEGVRIYTVAAGSLRGADGITSHRLKRGTVVVVEDGLTQDRMIEVVMHEAVHAATQMRFSLDPRLAARMDRLRLATIDAMGYSRGNLPYTLSNIDEFLAHAMTSESFQGELANIRLPDALAAELGIKRRLTLWDGFVELLKRAFGMADFTALEAAIRLGGSGFTPQSKQAEMRAAAQAARNTPPDAAIRASVQSILASASSHAHDMTERAPDMLRSGSSKVRSVGLGFMTASDIVESFQGLFNWTSGSRASSRVVGANPLVQVQKALAQQAVRGRELRDGAEPLVKALNALTKKNPQDAAALNLLMQEATTFAVHPDVPISDVKNKHLQGKARNLIQNRQQHPRLAREYQRLVQAHPEVASIWSDMSSYFDKSHQDMSTALIKNLLENRHFNAVRTAQRANTPLPAQPNLEAMAARFMANKATDQDKAWLGDTMVQHVAEVRRLAKVQGPYFPQRRFGDFVVQWEETAQDEHTFATEAEADTFMQNAALTVTGIKKRSFDAAGKLLSADDLKDPNVSAARVEHVVTIQNKGVEFFDTRGDAEARRRELNSESKHRVSEVERRRDQPGVDLELVPQQLHALVRAIGKQDMPDDRIALTQKAIEQAAARLLPGTSAKSALLRRNNVRGASTDTVRAMAAYANASSNYLAKLEYAPIINAGLEGMEAHIIENRYSGSEKTIARQEVLREMQARQRLDTVDVGTGGTASRLVRTLQSLTFINFLVSPAYTMINLMQQVLVTAPYLGARFGDAETAKALASANSAIFGKVMMGGARQFKDAVTGSGNITDFVAIVRDQISKGTASDKADLLAMLKHLTDNGLIDLSAGMELSRAGSPKITLAGKAIQYTEDLGRAFPAAAEVVNRAGSAIAAYRLARGPGKGGGMAHEAAMEFALEAVRKTQFDYTAANTARFMDARRSPFIALAMTFRKYAQGMYMLLGRSLYTAVKGASPQERSIARKTLTRLMISHMVFAGALGLPLEPLKIAIGLVSFLFGADEPWDYEKEVRQGLASTFGVGTAEVLTRGLPRLIGADLSSRVGLDSMLFAKGLQDFTPQTMQNTVFELAGGAPAAMLLQLPKAADQLRQGNMMQAAEQIVPKGIRDVIKAARLGDEGLRTKRGEQIGPDLSGGDMFWQAIGIQPSRVAEAYEARNAIKGAEREIVTARTRLMREYSEAKPGERQAVWSKIRDWNSDQNPASRVTMDQLMRSMQEQKRRAKEAQASPTGTYLPENRRYLQQEGAFANVR